MPAFALCLLLGALPLSASSPLPIPELPILAWPSHPDWLDVKKMGAAGDGKTDDTAAIQSALSLQQTTNNLTVFFPAGTYLITDTLVVNRTLGTALLGTGRTTTLLWGGGVSGGVGPNSNVSRLLWSRGNTRHYMEGLTFDAGNGCAVGLDHAASPGSQCECGCRPARCKGAHFLALTSHAHTRTLRARTRTHPHARPTRREL